MKYTEIELTAEQLCPACKKAIEWAIKAILKAFNVTDYTLGMADKTEEELVKEVERG